MTFNVVNAHRLVLSSKYLRKMKRVDSYGFNFAIFCKKNYIAKATFSKNAVWRNS